MISERFAVFAPDLWAPDGDQMRERPSPESGVAFLRSFMDAAGIERAHLVGSSLGGLIAGHFTIAHPERTRSLTLVGSAGLGREIAWSQRFLTLPGIGEFFFRPTERRIRTMLKLLMRRGDTPEELVRELHQESTEPGVTNQMLAALRAGVSLTGVRRSVRFLDGLVHAEIPVLICGGGSDPLFPTRHIKQAAAAIPGAREHVFEGSGHWPYFEDATSFNGALLDFLDSVGDP